MMKFFHNKGNKFFFVFLVLEISFLIFQKYSGTLGKRVIIFLSSKRTAEIEDVTLASIFC